ncbi:hypothetical protein [Halomonas alimentaria]|uniref:Adhesin n=1 Tax=Halomonas alimentaria TaxID=147248 RepID=A0A7X5AQ40_9GAMM|nr:hypothetical protein [Halomonas alimentaria]NAW33711.1 hypothetical protein [Halomonas alimentaria]
MKTFHKAPLALAITALMTAPAAFADNEFSAESDITSTFMNSIDVELKHKSDTDKDFDVDITVNDWANYYSGALVDSKQFSDYNEVTSTGSANNASVGDGAAAAVGATGNVGLNVAAGDSNAQANDAALAANDAADVFGQAEIFSAQHAMQNTNTDVGSPNTASLGAGSLNNASGNVGVNIAAGVGNIQQNALSASQNSAGGHARATVGGVQQTAGNVTNREALRERQVTTTRTSVSGTLDNDASITGDYNGTWQQTNQVYPEIWFGGTQGQGHDSGQTYQGHLDFDGQSADTDQFAGIEGGAVTFEVGDVALSGTLSGNVQHTHYINIDNPNDATLGAGALQSISGNVGVNIAAGSNNLQRNSLAIASSLGPVNPGNPPE